MNIRKLICCLAAVIMTTALGTAAASTGDRLIHQPAGDGASESSTIRQAILSGRSVYIWLQGDEPGIEVFDLDSGESAVYDLSETVMQMESQMTEPQGEGEAGVPLSESIGFFFPWNGEVYA